MNKFNTSSSSPESQSDDSSDYNQKSPKNHQEILNNHFVKYSPTNSRNNSNNNNNNKLTLPENDDNKPSGRVFSRPSRNPVPISRKIGKANSIDSVHFDNNSNSLKVSDLNNHLDRKSVV